MTVDLAFQVVGDGPPLLVLHGLFGSGSNWRGVARALSATHRVLSVDLRNHGASPWASTMGYADMAGDVLALMDREGLSSAAVLGHSMGGKVAMALALLHPTRVEQLCIVDIAPVAYADRFSPFTEAMRGIDMVAAAGRAEIRQMLALAVPDASVVPFLMQNLATRNDHMDWRINLAGIQASIATLCDFPAALRSRHYGGPVKVIAGGRSDYVRAHDGAEFLPSFPRATLLVIAEAGHWVHADAPQDFVAGVQGWLAEPSIDPCATRSVADAA